MYRWVVFPLLLPKTIATHSYVCVYVCMCVRVNVFCKFNLLASSYSVSYSCYFYWHRAIKIQAALYSYYISWIPAFRIGEMIILALKGGEGTGVRTAVFVHISFGYGQIW